MPSRFWRVSNSTNNKNKVEVMSLDITLTAPRLCEVYSANITHNLTRMAEEADLYMTLWRPEEIGITKADELIEPLRTGLALLKSDPERFKQFNSPNEWGVYENLVSFVEYTLKACEENPDATVEVSR